MGKNERKEGPGRRPREDCRGAGRGESESAGGRPLNLDNVLTHTFCY